MLTPPPSFLIRLLTLTLTLTLTSAIFSHTALRLLPWSLFVSLRDDFSLKPTDQVRVRVRVRVRVKQWLLYMASTRMVSRLRW